MIGKLGDRNGYTNSKPKFANNNLSPPLLYSFSFPCLTPLVLYTNTNEKSYWLFLVIHNMNGVWTFDY